MFLFKGERRRRTVVASILFVFYTATYFAQPLLGFENNFIDFLATGGVVLGIGLFLGFLPDLYYFILVGFAFFAQYLGMMWNFYTDIGVYDLIVHFSSGIIFAFFGKYFYEILKGDDTNYALKIFFSLGFAHLVAVIWEIYEFSVDQLFGMQTQGVGITDTMTDLISATIGNLSVIVYVLLVERRALRQQNKEKIEA